MGLGHTFLRHFAFRNAPKIPYFSLRNLEAPRCGALAMGTALGAAGLFICAPSSALLESQFSLTEGLDDTVKEFPNAFSRKGASSGPQEPYMAYNREGQRVPLADIVHRMKVRLTMICTC